MKLDVVSLDNKKSGSIDLDDAVFGLDARGDLLARAVNWQLAKRRSGSDRFQAVQAEGHRSCTSGYNGCPADAWWWRGIRPSYSGSWT